MVAVMLGGLSGDLSNIDDKLVPDRRKHGHSERNRGAHLVEAGPENFSQRYTSVAWQVEKHRLVLIWRTDRDVIAIASMPEPEIILQIFDCAFVDILIPYKLVTAVCDQVHRVKTVCNDQSVPSM